MNIDSLLEQIENILDSGTKITLSKKTAVNAEEIRECIAQLREIIPEEVDQAKSITANRSEIIEKAKSDAAASVARAQEKAQTLVEKTEAKSEQIISAANANAQKTVDSANKLADWRRRLFWRLILSRLMWIWRTRFLILITNWENKHERISSRKRLRRTPEPCLDRRGNGGRT